MCRLKTNLTLAVCGLALQMTAQAADQRPLSADGPALGVNVAALDVPPVLPPNDGAALSLGDSGSGGRGLNQSEVKPVQPNLAPATALPQATTPATTAAPAAAPVQVQELVIDPAQPNQLAYFSPRLGARFLIEPVSLPQYGSFLAARIVSQPAAGSPLSQLGLGAGDLITRLDGLPVHCTLELERHVLETGVRFIRVDDPHVCQGTMFIHPGMYFVDPYAPAACPLHGGCHQALLVP